jgi:MerR family transcriptional regulator, light-induced transcriptional regulator
MREDINETLFSGDDGKIALDFGAGRCMLYSLKSTVTEDQSNFLTTRQLARLWAVSEASIKRWADAGHLHASRTIGGHRRFSLAEVARFQAERGLGPAARRVGVARQEAPETGETSADSSSSGAEFDGERLAEQFFEAIKQGREGPSAALLLGEHLRGAELSLIFDEAVMPALRRVGDLWHAGEMSVAEEHLATITATQAVETLAAVTKSERPGAPSAVVCAAEDEFHQLPVICARSVLEAEGWVVTNLGPHTPFFALADHVEQYAPALVCVSSTTTAGLARGARDYVQLLEAARATGTRVVLGGPGFGGEGVRRQFPADLHAESFRKLVEFTRGLNG